MGSLASLPIDVAIRPGWTRPKSAGRLQRIEGASSKAAPFQKEQTGGASRVHTRGAVRL